MSEATKPGVKTSEFWLAAGSLAISAVSNLGLLPQETEIQGATAMIVSVLLSAWLGGQYIGGRTSLKATSDQKRDFGELLELVGRLADRQPQEADAGKK